MTSSVLQRADLVSGAGSHFPRIKRERAVLPSMPLHIHVKEAPPPEDVCLCTLRFRSFKVRMLSMGLEDRQAAAQDTEWHFLRAHTVAAFNHQRWLCSLPLCGSDDASETSGG